MKPGSTVCEHGVDTSRVCIDCAPSFVRNDCRDCGSNSWADFKNSWVCKVCRKIHGKNSSEQIVANNVIDAAVNTIVEEVVESIFDSGDSSSSDSSSSDSSWDGGGGGFDGGGASGEF